MNSKNTDKMRTINTLQNYYRLYLTNWKWWIIAVGGLPILILILLFDLIADSKVFIKRSVKPIHRFSVDGM
ncbi:MAG: hypothetical protein KDD45_18520 [Bdellovibrionales bacterium]|nr:hypothetical protein [Bdellovibrionales bacterium]